MDTKLVDAFNKQINHEFYNAYLYFAMSTYFDEIAMKGFCDYMKHIASQKLNNAQKIYDYIILRDEKLTLLKIDEPSIDWINATDLFSSALSCEELTLTKLNELYKIAKDTDDIAAIEYIMSLISNQVINVGKMKKLVFRIKNSNIISPNIEILELGIKEGV